MLFNLYKIHFLRISCITVLLTNFTFAQFGNKLNQSIYYEILQFPSDSQPYNQVDVDVHVAIIHRNLVFVKNNNNFMAEYEVVVAMFKGEKLIDEKTKQNRIQKLTYDQTISSRSINRVKFGFQITPGKYSVLIQLIDKNSSEPLQINFPLVVKDYYRKKIIFSDILLMDKVTYDSTKNLLPDIKNYFIREMIAFIAFVVPDDIEEVNLKYNILDIRDEKLKEGGHRIIKSNKIENWLIPIDGTALPPGRYKLRIWAEERSKAIEKWFQIIRSRSSFDSKESLDKAVKQMEYIVKWSKLRDILDAPYEDKKKLFKVYWKKWDPTPITPKNELMEEYYNRIDYSNQQFGSARQEGWESDRGRIYVIYGPPDRIEKRPSSTKLADTYLIWSYEILEREFIFADRGFGDYVLIRSN